MLTVRIIPCLDVRDGRVVKGVRFQGLRDAGDPAERAAFYEEGGADEIVLLDVSATPEGRATQVETVRRVREQLSIPLTVGGGVRVADNAGALLEAGADKVGINTAAVDNPAVLTEIATRYGSQCTILAIDAAWRQEDGDSPPKSSPKGQRQDASDEELSSRARPSARAARDSAPTLGEGPRKDRALSGEGGWDSPPKSYWEVVVLSGRKRTGIDAIEWAREGVERGAGEILLTSWDRDGTRAGYDDALIAEVSRAVTVPVIASGGADTTDHLLSALRAGADAVLAASIFHYENCTSDQLKRALAAEGVQVRL